MKINFDKNQLYFDIRNFNTDSDDFITVHHLSGNTVALCLSLLGHYGKWRNRWSSDLTVSEPQKINDADYEIICDIVDRGIEELMISSNITLEQMAKSLREIEYTHKKWLALMSDDKTIKHFTDKPDEPDLVTTNPSITYDAKSHFEYATTIGGNMGLGEVLGTALLDDLDINPLPNPFGQSSKLDTLNTGIEAVKSELVTFSQFTQNELYELIKWFAGSFRESEWSNLNPFSQMSFFKMMQNSLNDTSALFGADKPYLNLIVENLIEKRFYLARFYSLLTNNKAIKWYGTKPDTPGLFTPNPSIVNGDALTASGVDLTTVNQAMQTIADNSNKYEYSLFELMATVKHLLAKFSKSRAVPYQMPYPPVNDSIDSYGETVFGIWENGQVNHSLTDILSSGLIDSVGASYFIKLTSSIELIQAYMQKVPDLLEYIGGGINLTPFLSGTQVGLGEVFARFGFSMGDWRYHTNSHLANIASKQPEIIINPTVEATLQLDQNAFTINNEITVPVPTIHNELKQTINVDACCDDGTSSTPSDPIDPTNPDSPNQSPYVPATPIVLQPIPVPSQGETPAYQLAVAQQKNAYCGYFTYRMTQCKGFFKALDELLSPLQLLYDTFGASWIATYLKQMYPKTPVLGGVYLAKMSTVSLTKIVEYFLKGKMALLTLDISFDLVIEWCDISVNNVACGITGNITEDTVLDGSFFYSSYANAAINAGGYDEAGRLFAEIIKDLIDYKMYGLGVQSASMQDYVQYCQCPTPLPDVSPCDELPNGLTTFDPQYNINSSPFVRTNGTKVFNEFDMKSEWVLRDGTQFLCVYQEFETLGMVDPDNLNGCIPVDIDQIIGVYDVVVQSYQIALAPNAGGYQYLYSELASDYTPFGDMGSFTLPDGTRRQGNWSWAKLANGRLAVKGELQVKDRFDVTGNNQPTGQGGRDDTVIRVVGILIKFMWSQGSTSLNPFSVVPNNGTFNASWSSVPIPANSTVSLTSNGVSVPVTGSQTTGNYDPLIGVTLVLSVTTQNPNGSVTTTTYTQTIPPVTPQATFIVDIADSNTYYYADFSQLPVGSYTLAVNGYTIPYESEGYLPVPLQGLSGIVTTWIATNTGTGISYSVEVVMPVLDPCHNDSPTLSGITYTRQPLSSQVTVDFSKSANTDNTLFYKDGVLVAQNQNSYTVNLVRGVASTLKLRATHTNYQGCYSDYEQIVTIPNTLFSRYGDSASLSKKFAYTLANSVICKGLVIDDFSEQVTLVQSDNGYNTVTGNSTAIPLLVSGSPIKGSDNVNLEEWVQLIKPHVYNLPAIFGMSNVPIMAGLGELDFALAVKVDSITAFGVNTGTLTFNHDSVNGNLWLALKEGQGENVGLTVSTIVVTDNYGIYRLQTAYDYDYPLYIYPTTELYMSFMLNTVLDPVRAKCGFFDDNGQLISTFYLQDMRYTHVKGRLVFSGYRFNGISIPSNAHFVSLVEIELG